MVENEVLRTRLVASASREICWPNFSDRAIIPFL